MINSIKFLKISHVNWIWCDRWICDSHCYKIRILSVNVSFEFKPIMYLYYQKELFVMFLHDD